MSEVNRTAEQFWFRLFHELAHITLGHVGKTGGTSEEDERAADSWSNETLIPEYDFTIFRDGHDYSEKSVVRFARAEKIAPGIVVDRLQRERLIKYSMLNDLKKEFTEPSTL